MRNARIPPLAYYRMEKQTIPNKHSHMYTNTKYANVTFTSKCKCGIPRIIVLVNCARATSSSLCFPKGGPPVVHHRKAHAEHGWRLLYIPPPSCMQLITIPPTGNCRLDKRNTHPNTSLCVCVMSTVCSCGGILQG